MFSFSYGFYSVYNVLVLSDTALCTILLFGGHQWLRKMIQLQLHWFGPHFRSTNTLTHQSTSLTINVNLFLGSDGLAQNFHCWRHLASKKGSETQTSSLQVGMDECDECRVASSAKDCPFELMNNSVCIWIHSDPAEWKFCFPAEKCCLLIWQYWGKQGFSSIHSSNSQLTRVGIPRHS